jgi:hypothetical protein
VQPSPQAQALLEARCAQNTAESNNKLGVTKNTNAPRGSIRDRTVLRRRRQALCRPSSESGPELRSSTICSRNRVFGARTWTTTYQTYTRTKRFTRSCSFPNDYLPKGLPVGCFRPSGISCSAPMSKRNRILSIYKREFPEPSARIIKSSVFSHYHLRNRLFSSS